MKDDPTLRVSVFVLPCTSVRSDRRRFSSVSLLLGPLRAARAVADRPGVSGEDCVSRERAARNVSNSRPMSWQESSRYASSADRRAGRAAQGKPLRALRGGGGEPGRPSSLVTFFLGAQEESNRDRSRPPANAAKPQSTSCPQARRGLLPSAEKRAAWRLPLSGDTASSHRCGPARAPAGARARRA
jgi:hypothetical protein